MYQYAIFPFVIQQEPLEDLPVEMAATILRYPDGVSVLNAARSSGKLMSICLGDPVLRQRLQEHLKMELEARRRYILDPSASVTVTRQTNSSLFKKNVQKEVKRTHNETVGNVENLWKTNGTGGGKMKKARKYSSKRVIRL